MGSEIQHQDRRVQSGPMFQHPTSIRITSQRMAAFEGASAASLAKLKSEQEAKQQQKKKLDFDTSKWDRLDLSDDDEADCHPNIDKASWKRLKGQMRKDRIKEEEEAISKLKGKIEKHSNKIVEIEQKIASKKKQLSAGDSSVSASLAKDEAELKEAVETAGSYMNKLDHLLKHRKITADELCTTKEDFSKVTGKGASSGSGPTPPIVALPANEEKAYDVYVRKFKDMLLNYAKIRNDEASEEYIRNHPEILDAHAEGYFLLYCLHIAMTHVEEEAKNPSPAKKKENEKMEIGVARQHLFIQYILELAKGMSMDPRAAVRPFFQKTSTKSPEHLKGFEDELRGFVGRIRDRAKAKIANKEPSPLADDGAIRSSSGAKSAVATTATADDADDEAEDEEMEYERAPLGPGGLDPTEVLQSLPKELQEAFVSQNTDNLKKVLTSMPPEEADYHLKRCIDSGLWVANASEA